jgi:uncharacterized protein YecT (DUF1311 family)
MQYKLLLIPMLMCTPGVALGQSDCSHASDQATLTACANASKASAPQLKTVYGHIADNTVYAQIIDRLAYDERAKGLLVSAQLAWIAFRDAECAFSTSATTGGSAHPMAQATCMGAITQARVQELQKFLNCEKGDLSCPVPPE